MSVPIKTTIFRATVVQPSPIATDPRRVLIVPSVNTSIMVAAPALPKCCQKTESNAIKAETRVKLRTTWSIRRPRNGLEMVWASLLLSLFEDCSRISFVSSS